MKFNNEPLYFKNANMNPFRLTIWTILNKTGLQRVTISCL